MNRGDGTANDAEVLLHDGDDGREAVGGARRRCDDAILRRVVISVVDTIHDVEHGVGGILDRGGDEDALHAAVKVRLELIAGQELAGALEDEFDAVLVPRNRAGGVVGGVRDGLSVHDDRAVLEDALVGPLAVNGVVLGEVRG